jgi:uncharacterized protein involved in exopolysaccharide biosynthesis
MNETTNTPSDLSNADNRQSIAGDEVSLLELWLILWNSRWHIVGITAVFAILSVPYALMQTEWYRADVLLTPAEEKSTSGLVRQLGGLVGLAGVSVGGDGNAEPLAILQSRDFTTMFIEEHGLLPILYADTWDPETETWISDAPEGQPDMRDAVRLFRENILSVSEDGVTGLVSLAVAWTDPRLAAEWADLLVDQLNEHLRQRALLEAEANIKYLEEELGATNVFTLQQSIGRLLESELQKVMLAKGNEEFAFRVIDRAQIPKKRFKPNRTLIVIVATFLGGMLSIMFVFTLHAFKVSRRPFEK